MLIEGSPIKNVLLTQEALKSLPKSYRPESLQCVCESRIGKPCPCAFFAHRDSYGPETGGGGGL